MGILSAHLRAFGLGELKTKDHQLSPDGPSNRRKLRSQPTKLNRLWSHKDTQSSDNLAELIKEIGKSLPILLSMVIRRCPGFTFYL